MLGHVFLTSWTGVLVRQGVQVQSRFFGHGVESVPFQGLDGFGGKLQAHEAVLFGPKHALPLQVRLLQLLAASVGERHGVSVVGFLSRQVALAAHCERVLRRQPCTRRTHARFLTCASRPRTLHRLRPSRRPMCAGPTSRRFQPLPSNATCELRVGGASERRGASQRSHGDDVARACAPADVGDDATSHTRRRGGGAPWPILDDTRPKKGTGEGNDIDRRCGKEAMVAEDEIPRR